MKKYIEPRTRVITVDCIATKSEIIIGASGDTNNDLAPQHVVAPARVNSVTDFD